MKIIILTTLIFNTLAIASPLWECTSQCVHFDTRKEKKPRVLKLARGTSLYDEVEAYEMMLYDCQALAKTMQYKQDDIFLVHKLNFSRNDGKTNASSNSSTHGNYKSGSLSLLLLYVSRGYGYLNQNSHSEFAETKDTVSAEVDFPSPFDEKTCREKNMIEQNNRPRKRLNNGEILQG